MAEKHLFSTGSLIAALAVPLVIAGRLTQLGGVAYQYPPANLTDGSAATLADLSVGGTYGGGGYTGDYFLLDLGSVQTIGGVTLTGITGAPGQTGADYRAYASSDPTLRPGAAGTTLLNGAAGVASLATLTLTPSGTVTGRYILVCLNGGGTGGSGLATVAGASVATPAPASVEFALIQSVDLGTAFSRKELFAPASQSVFPVDAADHEGHLSLKVGSASFSTQALQMWVASVLTQIAANGNVPAQDLLTVRGALRLPAFSCVLTLTDTAGKRVFVTLNRCLANDLTIGLKLTDFAAHDFTLNCYRDASGNYGSIAFEQ